MSTVTVSMRRGAVYLTIDMPTSSTETAWGLLRQLAEAVDVLNAAMPPEPDGLGVIRTNAHST